MELALLPSTPGEDIMGRDSGLFIWHVIMEEHGMLHCHWPKTGICDVGPMHRRVKHHGPSNGHDGLDVSLSDGVVMVGTCASKADHLFKLGKLRRKFFGGKCGSVVSQE